MNFLTSFLELNVLFREMREEIQAYDFIRALAQTSFLCVIRTEAELDEWRAKTSKKDGEYAEYKSTRGERSVQHDLEKYGLSFDVLRPNKDRLKKIASHSGH